MRLLADYHLQLEMAAGSYALAMTSVGDTREGLERLGRALREIDSRAGARGGGTEEPDPAAGALPVNEQVFTIAGMEEEVRRGGRIVRMPLEACAGHIAASYVYLYPPGIPLAAPGERISRETVRHLLDSRRQGFSLEGLEEEGNMKVWIHG